MREELMWGRRAKRASGEPAPESGVPRLPAPRGSMPHSPRSARIGDYGAFWPYYLEAHGRPLNRALHFVGTAVSFAFILAFLVAGDPWLLLGAALGGYAFAWAGHAIVERNRPATFRYPLWSLVSDLRMCALALAGRLGPELARARAARAHGSE